MSRWATSLRFLWSAVAATARRGFSLVELLVVLAIISIMVTLVVPVVSGLLRSNQVDQSVATLAGLMGQAREAAIAGNTYVWVAFSAPAPSTPARGIWVATFQSQDATESPINTTVTPSWQTTTTIPSTNLQLINKLQNLPGVTVVDVSGTGTTLSASAITAINAANASSPPPTTGVLSLFEPASMSWTVAPLQNVTGYTSTSTFVRAMEFTPNGEARCGSSAWYNYIQFGLVPSTGSSQNAALFSISRLTGRMTVYRQ